MRLTNHLVIACSIPFKAVCSISYKKANKELEQFIHKAKQRYEPLFLNRTSETSKNKTISTFS